MNPYWCYYLENFQKAEGMNPCRCSYLEIFLRDEWEPKKDESILRKYSKRLGGSNPYRRPYLENYQGMEGNLRRMNLYLEK